MENNKKENVIVNLTVDFALEVMSYADQLQDEKKFVIANQMLRAGISIGANVWEAQNAESKADFIHKMKIAAKEADEIQFYLILCKRTKNYPPIGEMENHLLSVIKILSKIIGTSKRVTEQSFSNIQIN